MPNLEVISKREFLKLGFMLLGAALIGQGCSGEKKVSGSIRRNVSMHSASIAYIVDTSESMEGEKLEAAKKSLTTAIDAYYKHHAIYRNIETGIYYTRNAGEIETLVQMSRYDHDNLVSKVGALRYTYSHRPLGLAMLKAHDEIVKYSRGRPSIVMLSDGENNLGLSPFDAYDKILRAEIEAEVPTTHLYVIPFGMNPAIFDKIKRMDEKEPYKTLKQKNPLCSFGAKIIAAGNEQELIDAYSRVTEMILEETEFVTPSVTNRIAK
jgi:hypothetical protein